MAKMSRIDIDVEEAIKTKKLIRDAVNNELKSVDELVDKFNSLGEVINMNIVFARTYLQEAVSCLDDNLILLNKMVGK